MSDKTTMELRQTLCLVLVLVSTISQVSGEDCDFVGAHLRGDLATQPDGCQICTKGAQTCTQFDGYPAFDLPEPPVSDSPCGSRRFVIPVAAREVDSEQLEEIDQENGPQYVEVEECDRNWCTDNKDEYDCFQGTSTIDLRLTDGSILESAYPSLCKCLPKGETPSGDFEKVRPKLNKKTPRLVTTLFGNEEKSTTTTVSTTTIVTQNISEALAMKQALAESVLTNRGTEVVTMEETYHACMAHRMGVVTMPCVFPFRYHGVLQSGCILEDDVQYWCPTEVDANRNYIAKKWGYCSSACPITLPDCKTVSGPQSHTFCHFPFTYREWTFYSCIDLDSAPNQFWCATETDRHGYYIPGKWGFCSPNCGGGGGGGGGGDPTSTSTTVAANTTTTTAPNTTTTITTTSTTTTTTQLNTTTTAVNITTTTSTTSTTTTTTTTTTTIQKSTHIPIFFHEMPPPDDVAVYIPSIFDDPILTVIENAGITVHRRKF